MRKFPLSTAARPLHCIIMMMFDVFIFEGLRHAQIALSNTHSQIASALDFFLVRRMMSVRKRMAAMAEELAIDLILFFIVFRRVYAFFAGFLFTFPSLSQFLSVSGMRLVDSMR